MSCAPKTTQVLTLKSLLFLDIHLFTNTARKSPPFCQSRKNHGSRRHQKVSCQLPYPFTWWNEAGTNYDELCKVSDPLLQVSRRAQEVLVRRTSGMSSLIPDPLLFRPWAVISWSLFFLTNKNSALQQTHPPPAPHLRRTAGLSLPTTAWSIPSLSISWTFCGSPKPSPGTLRLTPAVPSHYSICSLNLQMAWWLFWCHIYPTSIWWGSSMHKACTTLILQLDSEYQWREGLLRWWPLFQGP